MTCGASSASPSATTRTAASRSSGSVSFSRKPLAPARSASYTYSSRSNVVRISTRVAAVASSPVMRRVASSPSISGMRMSISTTSGRSARDEVDGFGAVRRLADDLDVAADRSSTAKPLRTSAWSSATATRITSASP